MSRSLAQKDFHEFNMDMEIALGALALYGPEEAIEYLYDTHDIDVSVEQLERHRRRFPEKYQEIQEKLAQRIEGAAVVDARSNIAKANAPIALAIERGHQALQENRVSGVAAAKIGEQIANIQTKQKDTMMALQGRPAVVKEVRNLNEVFRALQAIDPKLVIDDAEVVNVNDNDTKELTHG